MALIFSQKTLRILAIGDPHFKKDNQLETDLMITALIKLVIESKPDIIVVLGDVLDRFETIKSDPLTRANRFLNQLRDSFTGHLVVLIGNHDRPNNNGEHPLDEHPFGGFVKVPKMLIVDEVKHLVVNNELFVFVPYLPCGAFIPALDKYTVSERSEGTDFKKARLIFAHQEFAGAKMNAITSNKGDKWPLEYPLVISGHIHEYHQPQPNIIYTGTPIQHGFGDRHDHAVMFLDLSGNERSGEITRHRVSLGLPRKIVVEIRAEDLLDYIPPPNCIVRLKVIGDSRVVNAMLKTEKVKELARLVDFKIEESAGAAQPLPGKFTSYTERLRANVSREPQLVQQMYLALFPN